LTLIQIVLVIVMLIGIMHAFSYFSWGIPYYSQILVLENVGIPLP